MAGNNGNGTPPNLLANPGFEDWSQGDKRCLVFDIVGGFVAEIQRNNIDPPPGWATWFVDGDGYHQPEVHTVSIPASDRGPARHRSGQRSAQFFTFSRKHFGGFMQRVEGITPGAYLRLEGWAHAWSNHKDGSKPDDHPHPDDPFWSDGRRDDGSHIGREGFYDLENLPRDAGARNFTFALGIDPTGGENPFSDNVVWSFGAHIYNVFGAVPPIEAVAEGGAVTVFLSSNTLWPFKHNDAYWDDISLVEIPQEEPELIAVPLSMATVQELFAATGAVLEGVGG